jgi:hypothetical protein
MTAAARKAAEDRFVAQARQEHPGASERDIQRLARAARDLFYADLAAAGVAARKARADARNAATAARSAQRQLDQAARLLAEPSGAPDDLAV